MLEVAIVVGGVVLIATLIVVSLGSVATVSDRQGEGSSSESRLNSLVQAMMCILCAAV